MALSAILPRDSARVSSAGVRALSGSAADSEMIEIARERGLGDLVSHRSRPLFGSALLESDLVLCMERMQRELVLRNYPTMTGRVRLLADAPPSDINDPTGRSRADYEACADTIERAIDDWRTRLVAVGLIPSS